MPRVCPACSTPYRWTCSLCTDDLNGPASAIDDWIPAPGDITYSNVGAGMDCMILEHAHAVLAATG